MNEQERTVWLEKNNISVTTASQNPREIEYMANVQYLKKRRDEYFSLTPLETTRENIVRAALRDQQPTALGGALRGTAAGVVSGVQTLRRLGEGTIMDAANSARYALEKNALTDRIGWINANIKRENYDTQEAYQAARNAELEKYRAELAEVETRYKNVAEFGRNEMNKLKKRQENFLKLSGLSKQEGDGFFYDVGNGAGSLLSALAITAIAKSPTAAAALFGGIAGRQGYEEALENGVSPEKALWVGTAAGAAEGVLEKVGLDIFLRGLSARGWTKRVIKNALTEAVQEGSQGGAEEFIMQHFGGREKEFNETAQDIAYQALLGGLIGGGVAGIPYIGKAFAQYSKADLEAIRKEQEAKIKTAEQQEAREQRITPPTPQQAEELARANGTERDAVTAHYNTVLQNGVQKFKDLGADEYTAEWLTANIIAQAGSQESLQEISQMIEDENNPATYSKQDILASAAEFAEAVRATAQELTPELKKQIWDIRDRVKQDALSAGLSEEEANLSATMQQALATVAYQITGVSPAEWYKGREIRFVNRRGDDTSFDFGANVPKENTTEAAQTQEAPAEYDVERDGLPDSFYQSGQVKQQVDLTQAFEDIIQLPPAERAAKAEQALNDLIGRAMDTATPPIQIQVTSGNKFHIKHSNVVLKKGQLKRHQTALTALEKVVNSAHQLDKDGTVDAAHNTRPATIAHKQQVKEYVYFEAPIQIGRESFVVELAAERVKGQDENLLDLYNVHIKRNPAAALKSTLPQGSSTNSIGNKEDFVKGETFYQSAYHGTPHRFDNFSTAHIGTGEGAQAHGWGLYFAQSKEVSEKYRQKLQHRIKKHYTFLQDGKELPADVQSVINNEVGGHSVYLAAKGDLEELRASIKRVARSLADPNEPHIKIANELTRAKEGIIKNPKMSISKFLADNTDYRFESIAKSARLIAKNSGRKANISDVLSVLNGHLEVFNKAVSVQRENANKLLSVDLDKLTVREEQGQLFEVDIPENDVLLDEDKTFNEQPEKVREALKRLAGENESKLLRESISENETGKSMYRAMVSDNMAYLQDHNEQVSYSEAAKNASELLLMEGVQGITYNGGRDGRAYVIFDDKAIDVINTFYQQAAQDMFEADPETVNAFAKDVRKALEDDVVPAGQVISMGQLPYVYTAVGLPDSELKTNKTTLLKAMGRKGKHPHNVPQEVLEHLPALVADPKAIFKSSPNSTNPNGYVAVLDAVNDKGEQIIAAISPSKKGETGFTFIPSVYEKGRFADFVKKTAEEGGILYIKEKGSDIWGPLQSRPRHIQNLNNSIRTKEDIVKTRQFNQDENAELDADVEYLYSKFEGKIDKSDIRSILVSRQTAEANKIGGGLERVMRTFQARNTDITEEQIRSIYNYQPVRLGKVEFTGRGPVITLLEGANKSTVAHEMTHVFLRELELLAQKYDTKLMRRHMAKLEAFLGPKQANGFYSEVQHEKLAKGYLDYMRTQEAPNTEMKNIFERFRDFLEELYEDIRGKKLFEKITPAAKEFFDDFLAPLNITTPDAKKFRGKIKEVREAVEDIRKRRLPRAGLGITLQDVKDLYSQIKKRMPKKPETHLLADLRKHGAEYKNAGQIDKEAYKNARIYDKKGGVDDKPDVWLQKHGYMDFEESTESTLAAAWDLIQRALDGNEIYRLGDETVLNERENYKEELNIIRQTSDSLAAAQDVLEKINDMERKGYRVIDRADVKIIEEKLKKVGDLAEKELDKLENVKNEIIAEFKKRVDADGISAELDRMQSAKNKTAFEAAARKIMMQIESAYIQRTLKQTGLLNNPHPRGAGARYAEAVFDKELAESGLPEVKTGGWKRFAEEVKDVFASVSDRVARIDKELARQLEEIPRRRVMRNSKYRKYFADYIDYIYKYVKPNERDFMLLSWYQMNGFYKAEMDIAKKYANVKLNGKNLEQLIAEKDAGLKQIWEDAIQAGLKVGWLEYYNPRRFKDADGFIAAVQGTPEWSKIERMLKDLDPDNQFTQEQKAIAINKWLRGYEARDLAIASPKNIKRRDLIYVSAPLSKFYKNSYEALIDYADDMAKAVSVKEVFGVNAENLEQSIGHILLKVKEKHSLTHWEEEAVRKALVAFLQPKNPSEAVRQVKTWTYLLTITNPFSTLSQLEDLGLAAVKWGHANFMRALKTRGTDKWLTLENIGAETLNVDLNKEFENRTEKALRWILGKTAFTWMDRLGKESYINADFQARQEMARKSPKKLMTELREMFSEEEAQSVLEALKTGDINNEALKSLLYYDISRVQPLSMMDMPYAYGRGGNLRYLYTLKSFALRRANFIFSEAQNKLHAAKTPEEYSRAVKELLGLLVGLVGYGALTNILKNLLLGRSVDLPEEAIDALLQNMMITRYVIKRAADDPMDAFVNAVMPPGLGIINDVWKDAGRTLKGNQNLQDARVWTNVPLIGKEYYWWFGGGALKTKKDNKKKELFKIQGWAGNIR